MGEINVGESLEWLVESRPAIGLYAGSGLLRGLKNAPPERITTSRPDELVVFFGPDSRTSYTIDLTDAEAADPPITEAFELVRGREPILATIAGRLDRLTTTRSTGTEVRNVETPQRGFLRFEVPDETAAHRVLFLGSACYLVMPVEAAFREPVLAQTHAADVWERARAAHQLGNYPDAECRSRLHAMLEDPESATLTMIATGRRDEKRVYPPRQLAYDVLTELGELLTKPAGYSDAFPYAIATAGSRALRAARA